MIYMRKGYLRVLEKTQFSQWALLYSMHVLPECIRNMDENYSKFKTVLDIFLSQIPDCPVMKGYITHNYDNNNRQTNSLIFWVRNMKLGNWMDTRIGQHGDT